MSTKDDDGEEWKEDPEDYSSLDLRAYYDMLKGFVRRVVQSPEPTQSYLLVAEQFKPEGTHPKAWRRSCIDALVDGWINEDDVFRRARGKKPVGLVGQKIAAYRDGLDYVMREGSWPEPYVAEAKRISDNYKEE